jgi:ElaB/YqjD/DUF883 family membrane-anchored ribosome-binding protein
MATAIRQGETKGTRTEPCAWPTLESVEQAVREARRTVTGAHYAAEDLAARGSLGVRRHPLASVGLAAAAGTLFGCVAGFAAGRFSRHT